MEKCPIFLDGNVTLEYDIIHDGLYSYRCEFKLCDSCGSEFADNDIVDRNKQHYNDKTLT